MTLVVPVSCSEDNNGGAVEPCGFQSHPCSHATKLEERAPGQLGCYSGDFVPQG